MACSTQEFKGSSDKIAITTGTSEGNEDERLETDEEEDMFFQDIYLLREHGIAIEDIKLMQNYGLNTIKGIQMTTTPKLLNIFTSDKVNQVKEACNKVSLKSAFITALEVGEERKRVYKISTGSVNIDKLLEGGIESMSVTEVFGEARTGKTQLAHTLCVTAQIPVGGYPGGKVMYIDTEHTFRPGRIRTIAKRFELDENSVQGNILYARAYNSEHQYELLKNVGAKFHEEAGVFKLLIVDSIMALFRVDFCGRGQLVDRQQKLGQLMACLQKISEEYNVAVFITNQITTDFTFPLTDFDVPKPIGGNILAHASTTRIALKKGPGNVRIAMIYDSPDLEENEEAFLITSGGVKDPLMT